MIFVAVFSGLRRGGQSLFLPNRTLWKRIGVDDQILTLYHDECGVVGRRGKFARAVHGGQVDGAVEGVAPSLCAGSRTNCILCSPCALVTAIKGHSIDADSTSLRTKSATVSKTRLRSCSSMLRASHTRLLTKLTPLAPLAPTAARCAGVEPVAVPVFTDADLHCSPSTV